jgi:hypothetical protein
MKHRGYPQSPKADYLKADTEPFGQQGDGAGEFLGAADRFDKTGTFRPGGGRRG